MIPGGSACSPSGCLGLGKRWAPRSRLRRSWGGRWDCFDSWGLVLGSWGGDDRPALDGGLYSADLVAVCFDGRGGLTVMILEVADLDSCLWGTSPRTYLIAWVEVFQ